MEILQEKLLKTEISADGIISIMKERFVKVKNEIKQEKWRCVCLPNEAGKISLREQLTAQQAEYIIGTIWTEDVMQKFEINDA